MDVLYSTRHLSLISLLSVGIEAYRLLNYLSIQCHLFVPQVGVTRPWNQSHLKWINETLIKNAALLWMGVREEGWSVLIWFCFQTTWCIRTIKISASHSLIALWVSAAGPGLGFGFLAVLPTLGGQVIYFGPLPCLGKPCFSECVSGVTEQGQKCPKSQRETQRAAATTSNTQ